MDKGALSPKSFRSPLGSIVNQSNPTSEDHAPDDKIYNASVVGSDKSGIISDSVEYTTGNESPEVHVAKLVRLSISGPPQQVRTPRSQSIDVHFPTPLDSISEITTSTVSQPDIGHHRSQSLDETRMRSSVFRTSSSNETSNCVRILDQFPNQPVRNPPLRVPTPPNLPTFNTTAASRYHIPPPPRSLRERLDGRPSPERLSWIRQTRGIPSSALMRAEDGTLIRGLWQAPASDHTGSSRRSFNPAHDPFNRQRPSALQPTTQSTQVNQANTGSRSQDEVRNRKFKRI